MGYNFRTPIVLAGIDNDEWRFACFWEPGLPGFGMLGIHLDLGFCFINTQVVSGRTISDGTVNLAVGPGSYHTMIALGPTSGGWPELPGN